MRGAEHHSSTLRGRVTRRAPCIVCGTPSIAARCPEHPHGRDTSHWQELRALVLKRDGYGCQIMLEACTGRATSVHLDPRLKGQHLLATESDCRSACRFCHDRSEL